MRRDLGDFPTPPALVAAVLATLGPVGDRWERVLEPTCGGGRFLDALVASPAPPAEIIGVERNPEHVAAARSIARGPGRCEIIEADLFGLDLGRDLPWRGVGPLLVVGNPPWVTSAELGVLGSSNGPARSNGVGLRGLDAVTGAANFDLAEAVWRKLLTELAGQRPTIALLCKASVARRIFVQTHRAGWSVDRAEFRRIDARTWFRASVEAGLLRLDLGDGPPCPELSVFADLASGRPERVLGVDDGRAVVSLPPGDPAAAVIGRCGLTWRQGVKHDLAPLMELIEGPDGLRNGRGERVEVEPDRVFPLRKGSDLAVPGPAGVRRAVIVTQRRLGDDTRALADESPKLWDYLTRHADRFAARKSSIYRDRPPFAMFGIGDYAFAPFKVAISGLHRRPRFRALGPEDGRPILLDDTCYFLACRSAEHAALVWALLDSPAGTGAVEALAFADSKRPVTKGLLQRIDLLALWRRSDRPAMLGRAEQEWRRLVGPEAPAGGPGWPDPIEILFEDSSLSPARGSPLPA